MSLCVRLGDVLKRRRRKRLRLPYLLKLVVCGYEIQSTVESIIDKSAGGASQAVMHRFRINNPFERKVGGTLSRY